MTTPGLTQKTADDGSFCFRSLPAGEYLLIFYKTGFLAAQPVPNYGPFPKVILHPGKPSRALLLGLTPAPSISQVPEDAFNTSYAHSQRAGLSIDTADFSPDGRYVAIGVGDILTGRREQAWLYDLDTHHLLAVTPKPEGGTGIAIADIAWLGNGLYTTVIDFRSKKLFFKTEGEITSTIESLPSELQRPRKDSSTRRAGPYAVSEAPITPATHSLYRVRTGHSGEVPIATVTGSWMGNWLTVDDPPTVLYGVSDWYYGGIGVFYLQRLHRQLFRLPVTRGLTVLAVRRSNSGFLVAYTVRDTCAVTESLEGIDPATIPHNYDPRDEGRPSNLCFVDIPVAP